MLSDLNPEQTEAATYCDGPALILAGPGTGKSRILEERAVYLIEQGAYPGEIALVSFTRRAAGENLRHIAARLPEDLARMIQVSTLHSLALRVLVAVERKHRRRVPEIADAAHCFEILRRALSQTGLDPAFYPPLTVWKSLLRWKETGRNSKTLDPPLRQVADRYQDELRAERKWDLADLVANAIAALQTESYIAAAFRTIRYLMLDEMQDTSLMEYCFLREILGPGNPNFFGVGAAAQSIYGWRGADAQTLFARFEQDYPEARRIVLRQNYRSGEKIIAAAAALVPEEREVYLSSQAQRKGQVFWKECPNELAEAALVAALIRELRERDRVPWTSFAVLFRSWAQAPPIEQALIDGRIPYTIGGDGAQFYERPEVRGMYAILRCALAQGGQIDPASLDGEVELAFRAPASKFDLSGFEVLRGEGQEGRLTLEALASAAGRPDLPEPFRIQIGERLDLLSRLSGLTIALSPAEMIEEILWETDWELAVQDDLEGKKQLANLRAFQEEARKFPHLLEFTGAVKNKIKSVLNGQGVAVSTIHAAKGLEWPAVFVVGLNQGALPSAQSLEEAQDRDPVEERHVAHVAFSRARALLFLSWKREEIGRARQVHPSEFLARLRPEIMQEYQALHEIQPVALSGEGKAGLEKGGDQNGYEPD